MTDEPDGDTDPSGEAQLSDSALPKAPAVGRGDLDAFAAIQRQFAAVDLTALTAAQQAINQATAIRISHIVAAHDASVRNFARSFDFSGIAAAHKSAIDAGALRAAAVEKQWANSLSRAIDLSALHDAVASSAALLSSLETNQVFAEAFKLRTDVLERFAESINKWIPGNLHDVQDLAVVAAVALGEGIPLSWIPRTEIVIALIEADGPEERLCILTERRDDVLDDCHAGLNSITHEWSVQCRSAIQALRLGLDGPAQSHASNIVDSVRVIALHGRVGRDEAKERAEDDFDDLPLQLAAENLTLRPLLRAFTSWWPDSGTTPPDHFARHPTSHAVGHVGVFAPLSALIAVMLATSVTVQYAPDEPTETDANQAASD